MDKLHELHEQILLLTLLPLNEPPYYSIYYVQNFTRVLVQFLDSRA